jgi:tetratricopeptide (TPR) repeat protein
MLESIIQVFVHPILSIFFYGIVAALVFNLLQRLQENTIAHLVYLTGLLGLFVRLGTGQPLVGMAGLGNLIYIIFGGLLGLIANAPALRYTLTHLLTAAGRELTSADQIVYRKTYDRAVGAESRGDLEMAAALYRQEIESDPEDREAYRRLAEVLLKHGKHDEAVSSFRKVIEMSDEPRERSEAMFRLAEVFQDELHDGAAARKLYQAVIHDNPRGKYAEYARSRLGGSTDR